MPGKGLEPLRLQRRHLILSQNEAAQEGPVRFISIRLGPVRSRSIRPGVSKICPKCSALNPDPEAPRGASVPERSPLACHFTFRPSTRMGAPASFPRLATKRLAMTTTIGYPCQSRDPSARDDRG
jgi:hypothetical protein